MNAAAKQKHHQFVIQYVQPALLGLLDGSVSTLAPLFAAAGLTHQPIQTFYVDWPPRWVQQFQWGLAEALSDDGTITGRGNPWIRGLVTGGATGLGGMLHTLPFLFGNISTALHLAYAVVIVELLLISFIRFKYMQTPLAKTIVQVVLGGLIVLGVGVWLGTS